MDKNSYEIRPIKQCEWEDAMNLAWDTFLLYEAPEYSMLGVHNFKKFVKDPILKKMFLSGEYYAVGAFVNDRIVGIISVRSLHHISLLFVDTDFHKKGIATALMKRCIRDVRLKGESYLTVNASPYAVGFYHKIGFIDLTEETEKDGIKFTPMKLQL